MTHTCWRKVSTGSSWKAQGVWLACFVKRLARTCIQSEPFSMLATRSVGCRSKTPWTIRDANDVVDRSVGDQHRTEGIALAETERVAGTPRRGDTGVVAAVAEMERDRNRRFSQTGPHRVVELVTERPAGPVPTGYGGRPHVDDPGALVEQPVHFLTVASGSASESMGTAMSRSWYE